jgi:class 3 adenylate cyclase/tetratricopeptide (TPR) repeat protein
MVDPRRERKVVTVLFADLVGFTAQAEELDPEDVEAILRPYHLRLRSDLERFGGTVEKFIGDAVMALFGAPVAHEDDPERAVRAALAIRDWAREQADAQVRIAVNTGEALINLGARPEAGEGMATGDVVNTTARLQSAAPVNGVLVGETTYRATRHVIDYREHEPVEAKGKAAHVTVWEAIETKARFGVDLLRQVRSPLVGRERERTLLRETLVRVREERSPQLVTLVGVPGIGKSRLVYELMGAVKEGGVLTYWRQGRSLPYGEGVSYWALGEMIKAQAGVLETDSVDDAGHKLKAAVADLLPDLREAEWVESHVRPLAGVSAETIGSTDRQNESFTAWRRFFEAMAERRPLVLVFEDIHWADDGLLDFLDHLVEWATNVPILVVCTARPELLDRRPGWGGGKLNATTLSLSPLSNDETARLFAALLDQRLLQAEVQQRLLARAGGNPLYAEQYAQMHSERAGAAELPMPESVQGIIAARLDLLPPEEKQLLQDAAVLGKVFWLGGLVNGRSRGEAEQHLHALDRKGFVQRAQRSSVADEAEHSFRHVLVRDTAYSQIPRAARAEKHRRVAEWIEALGRPDDHAEMLAYHYMSALELTRASGQPIDNVAEPARRALAHAGDRALALNSYSAAASFYEQAVELWPDGTLERARLLFRAGRTRYLAWQGGEGELEAAVVALRNAGDTETAAEAETTLFEALSRKGQRDLGDAHLAKAWALLEHAPPSRPKAIVLMNMALSNMLASRHEQVVETGRHALEMADLLGLDAIRAAVLDITGVSRVALGDRAGIGDIERAAEIAANASAPFEVARAYNNLASVLFTLGDLHASRQAHAECIRVSERYGQAIWRRWQRSVEVWFAYLDGKWDKAAALADEVLDLDRGSSDYTTGDLLGLRALVRLGRGDHQGALADAERSVELSRPVRDPQALYGPLLDASYVAVAAGQLEWGTALVEEWLAFACGPISVTVSNAGLLHVAWTMGLLGRSDELLAVLENESGTKWVDTARAFAAGELELAADLCAQMECRPEEAYARLRLAERLAADGSRAEAEKELLAALAFYRSVGATHYIREGDALLAATA